MVLFRSWMFVPGNVERRLAKVKDLPADVIIYDLEDSVPLDEKEKARIMVRGALKNNTKTVNFVRVNAVSTDYFLDDINEIIEKKLTGIVLPKSERKEEILFVDYLLSQFEKKMDIEKNSIVIVPLIESALGLLNTFEIASSCKRVKQLAFGSADFALDIHAELTKEGSEILYARSHLVASSRAAGIDPPIDAVYLHIKDKEGLLRDTKQAKQLGFQGKLAVHPDQIEVINGVFTPGPEEIEEAKAIVDAFHRSLLSGQAAIQLNGKIVDYPVVERAKRIVDQARALGL